MFCRVASPRRCLLCLMLVLRVRLWLRCPHCSRACSLRRGAMHVAGCCFAPTRMILMLRANQYELFQIWAPWSCSVG